MGHHEYVTQENLEQTKKSRLSQPDWCYHNHFNVCSPRGRYGGSYGGGYGGGYGLANQAINAQETAAIYNSPGFIAQQQAKAAQSIALTQSLPGIIGSGINGIKSLISGLGGGASGGGGPDCGGGADGASGGGEE